MNHHKKQQMRAMAPPPLWIEVHHLVENGRGQPAISPRLDPDQISDDEDEHEHEHGFRSRLPNNGSYIVPRLPFLKKKLTQKIIDENILLAKGKALEERRKNGLTQSTHSSSSETSSRYSIDTTRTPSERRAARLGKMNQRLSELSKLSNLALGICEYGEDKSPKGDDDDDDDDDVDDDDKPPNQEESACSYKDLNGVGLLQKKIIESRIQSREKRICDTNERLQLKKLS